MKTDQKKLRELLLWVLLFLVCLAGSIYYIITSNAKNNVGNGLIVIEEKAEDLEEEYENQEEPAERFNEDGTKDVPSGVVEGPEK